MADHEETVHASKHCEYNSTAEKNRCVFKGERGGDTLYQSPTENSSMGISLSCFSPSQVFHSDHAITSSVQLGKCFHHEIHARITHWWLQQEQRNGTLLISLAVSLRSYLHYHLMCVLIAKWLHYTLVRR